MGSRDSSGRDRPVPGQALETGSDGGRRSGLVSSFVPDAVGSRLLACSLEVPPRIVVGQQTPFRFHVKNRAPLPLSFDLPSSRVWGWSVDDVPEAGTGRFDPPAVSATVVFGPMERRTFTGWWDGHIRESTPNGDVWNPLLGEHDLRTYLAVDSSAEIAASSRVRVVDPHRR